MFNLEQGKRNVENVPQKVIKSYEQLSCIIRIFICRLPVLGTRQKYLPRYIQSRKFQNREVDMNTNVLPSNLSTNQLLSSLSPFPVVMNIKRIYLPLEVKRKHTHTHSNLQSYSLDSRYGYFDVVLGIHHQVTRFKISSLK